MKRIALLLTLILCSCSNKGHTNAQEQLIADFMQNNKGVKTDLKIEFSKLDMSDITVGDSITILRDKFNKEKESEIKYAQSSVNDRQKTVDKVTRKIEANDESTINKRMDKVMNESLKTRWEEDLEDAKAELKEAQNWKPDYLERYEGRDKDELLVKKAVGTLSYFNPKLQTRQETTETFIFSKEGSEVLGVVIKGEMRTKS